MGAKLEILKNKINHLKKTVIPAALIVVLFALGSFVQNQHGMQACTKPSVNIKGGDKFQFVNEEEIMGLINKDRTDIATGKMIKDVHLSDLEVSLRKSPYVKDAQASMDMNGQLNIDIIQREPVVRVINPMGQDYYIDKDNKRMPLSDHYSARVPVATALHCSSYTNDSLLKLLDSHLFYIASCISQDKYIQALAGQLVIHDNYEYSIIPRLGKFEIMLGDTSDMKDKFARLRAFYKSSLPQVGWAAYREVSVKYRNQIIANKE